jgi:hypothetical protein
MASNITSDFTIKVTMQDRWIPHFLSMLQHMQHLGDIGSSREITFFSDGDGDFRPTFSWDIECELADPLKDKEGTRYYDAG